MKFTMNDDLWEIKEIDNSEMNMMGSSDLQQSFTHGLTRYSDNTIYLNKDTPNKRKTLLHELTHCFMYEYGHNQFDEKRYGYEDVCEIVASSHDIINKIADSYFKKEVK